MSTRSKIIILLGLISLIIFNFEISLASAAAPPIFSTLNTVATESGQVSGTPPAVVVGQIISSILGILGFIFFGLTLYAGFTWMTAGGNEEKIKKAKKIITSSIIGLIIVITAYSISRFIIGQIISSLYSGRYVNMSVNFSL